MEHGSLDVARQAAYLGSRRRFPSVPGAGRKMDRFLVRARQVDALRSRTMAASATGRSLHDPPDAPDCGKLTTRGNFCGSPKWTSDSRRVIAYCMSAEMTLANRRPSPEPGNDTRLVSSRSPSPLNGCCRRSGSEDQPVSPTLRNNTTGDRQATDPGKALVTGLWADIGKVKGPILRGLASRAPYFRNGSAAS